MSAIILAIVLIAIDQIIKYACVLKLNEPVTLIPHFIELYYVENRGAAFGIMAGKTFFLTIVPVLIIVGLVFYYKKLSDSKGDKYTKFAITLIVSGAIGNLIDRVFRGYVVDMFHFTFFDFPVFNFADILVVCGAIILVIVTFVYGEEK